MKTLNLVQEHAKTFEPSLLSKTVKAIIHSGLTLGLIVSSATFAQEAETAQEDAKKDDSEIVEKIVVTGVRASQRSAIDRKKLASTMSDSIVAEDIGDFPDKNIAEALSRVTGIQLDREFGEGGGVSIRGVEPELTRVEINGISSVGSSDPFASTGRSNDFRSMASELVSALDVIKGSEARLTEGGIGGTIKITTRKPNDFKKDYLSLNAENQFNTLTDEHNQKFNLIGVHKFSDDLGILVNITAGDKNTAFHALRNTAFNFESDIDGSLEKTFVNPNYADVTTVEGCDGNETCEMQWYDPKNRIPRASIWQRDENRISANSMIQYRISDSLSAHVGITYNERDFVQNDQNYQLQEFRDAMVDADTWMFYDNHRIQSVETAGSFAIVNRAVDVDWSQKNAVVDAGFEYQHDLFTLTGTFGYSDEKQTIDQTDTQAFGYRIRGMLMEFSENGLPIITEENLSTGVDYTTSGRPDVTFNNPITETNRYTRLNMSDIDSSGDETLAQFDFVIPMTGNFLTTIKTGVRYTIENQDYARYDNDLRLFNGSDVTAEQNAQLLSDNYVRTPEFFRDFNPGVDTLDGWNTINVATFKRDFIALGGFTDDDLVIDNLRSIFDVKMETQAFYVQGDFETEVGGLLLWGNAGVRYVQTDVDTTGIATVDVSVDDEDGNAYIDEDHPEAFEGTRTVSNDYSEVLPSINVNLELMPDELILYAGASKVMAHPKAKDLNIAAACRLRLDSESIENGNPSTCSGGNPYLDPYVAKQFDIALNWYPNEDTMVSAAMFKKNLDTYILSGSQAPVPDVDYFGDGNLYEVRAPANSAGVNTQGYELSVATFFSMLPAPLNNIGMNANYTYTTADNTGIYSEISEEELDLIDMSKNTYNFSVYYSTEEWNVKLAYNYRSSYLDAIRDSRGNPYYVDAAGFLDGKITYQPDGSKFKYYFDARNLTKQGRDYIGGTNAGIYERRYYGRDFSIGVTYKM